MSDSRGESLMSRLRDASSTIRFGSGDSMALRSVVAVAAVVAVLAGASPTGSTVPDLLIVATSTAVVVVAGSTVAWWVPLVALGIAISIAGGWVIAAVGVIAAVAGLAAGALRRDGIVGNAALMGVAVNLLIRSEFDAPLGVSAFVGIATCLSVVIVAVMGASARVRRLSIVAAGLVVIAAIAAIAGVAVAGLGVRDDAKVAVDEARAAVDLLSDGEYEGAADGLDLAAASFERVDGALGGSLALPSRLIPVVGQNVRAGSKLASSAASTLREAAEALREIDPSALSVRGGAIDVAAVRRVEAPLRRVQEALQELRSTTADVRSVWLLDRLTTELDELDVDLDQEEPRLQNAIDAVELAPDLLGGDGARRYLVLFTTPAEARGLGGFVGNYAELTIDDGVIEISESARRSDLEAVLARKRAVCDGCPSGFLDVYGRYGFTSGDGGAAVGRAWSNLTMSPSFPDVATVASILYPLSGGSEIDGVFVMDPYVLAALMQYTGSVDIPGLDITIEPESAAEYILRDQYEFATVGANDDRIDALDTLATVVFARLQEGSLPEPSILASDLAPMIAERRLLGWTKNPAEQALFDRIGLLGSLPELGADGGFSVTVNNAAGNKVDAFLKRTVDVDVVAGSDGGRRLVASVELFNGAPTQGLPTYAIGNLVGLPSGSNRLLVTLYGPDSLTSLLVNGEPAAFESLSEAGWSTARVSVDVASMESVRFDAEFDLGPGNGGEPVTFEQPLADRE